ncbi:MAG: NAD-dependent epimerase/dehydratase family protein [Nocardioides sp.]
MAIIGYGFIGRRIAHVANTRGWRVTALTHEPNLRPADPAHDVVVGDACDASTLARVMQGVKHVVFAAGTVKPAESNLHPLDEVSANLRPLISTLAAMRDSTATSMTFLSSAGTVYGPDAEVPTPEDAPLWPISSYGVLKVAAERYINLYAHQYDFAADILRCANVYGPGEPTSGSQGLIGVTRGALLHDHPVVMFGDGSTRRDFIHVDDVALVVEELARVADGVRVLNVGSGRSDSVAEVIDAVAHSLGKTPVFDHHPARPTDVPLVQLDVTRLRSLIDFTPRELRSGLVDGDPAVETS